MKKDLAYIREHVKVWPDSEGVTGVRLDYNGEICFGGNIEHDFYPEGLFHRNHPCFIPAEGCLNVGTEYSKEEWEAGSSTTDLEKRIEELEAELEEQKAWNVRLDNELQGKALTDDGVLADAYFHCVDLIDPWVGDKITQDTLINSVTQSLEFLIEQWREKVEVETALKEAEDKIKDMSREFTPGE